MILNLEVPQKVNEDREMTQMGPKGLREERRNYAGLGLT